MRVADPRRQDRRDPAGEPLTDSEWHEAIARIGARRRAAAAAGADAGGPGSPVADREHPRFRRAVRCLVRADGEQGRPAVYAMRTRNISRGGVAVVHRAPLRAGSSCTVALEAAAAGVLVEGTVMWCQALAPADDADPVLAGAPLYEIGIRFEHATDIGAFIRHAA